MRKQNTDLTDVLSSLKNIVTDKGETLKEAVVSGAGEMLILAPPLRVVDDASDDESQTKETLEEIISRMEELITETDGLWEAGATGQGEQA